MIFLSLMPRKWQNKTAGNFCNSTICIADNGFHTDILLAADNNLLNYKYLGYGWGDRFFFMKNPEQTGLEEKFIGGFKALFSPTPTAMRVGKYSRLPRRVKCVRVSQKDYLELRKYIDSSFKLSARSEIILLEKHPRYRTNFYAGKGTYSIFRTCNSWTAEALRKADLNTPVWGAFSFSIMLHLKTNCTEKD